MADHDSCTDRASHLRAAGEAAVRRNDCPQFRDACFSGEYPIEPADMIARGFHLKAAE